MRRSPICPIIVLTWLAIVGASACSNSPAPSSGGDELQVTNDLAQVAETLGDTEQALDVTDDSQADVASVDVADSADAGNDSASDQGSGGDAACTEAGCVCQANSDCNSGFCLEIDGGKACAALCAGGCATGFKCSQLSSSGGDIVNVCTPATPRLCEPCKADSDCNNVLGGADNRCVPYSDNTGTLLGHFCGAPCGDSSQCPAGFTCQEKASAGGVKSSQCIKQDLVCGCDARATQLALSTACENGNDAGTCTGKRSCGPNGLGGCDAPSALPEQCNLKDDNCDGQTDEPTVGMCDDNLACTYDNCIAGQCQHPPKTGACDDQSACTTDDHCSDGVCKGTGTQCDDKNPCTADTCDPTKGCQYDASSGAGCSDNNVCTVGDACTKGACLPGAATVCDDNNACTTDTCDAIIGCVFKNNELPCTDGNICTLGDTCAGGICQSSGLLPCSDGNPCTDDSCDTKKGCIFTANTATCDDSNGCTVVDTCVAAKCVPGKAQDCKDLNPCTDDSCDSVLGCTHLANTAPCDDGSVCTLGDACAGGQCNSGQEVGCNDGNPCTNDSCDPQVGCQHAANIAPCSDGNSCTAGDSCAAGSCAPGVVLTCDDGNSCTDDACDPSSGCLHKNNKLPCNDGDVCTIGDLCADGFCIIGPSFTCNDGNNCTDDSCDPNKGCVFINNTKPCSDNNGCTGGDTCAGGKCLSSGGCDANALCTPGAQNVSCVCNKGFVGNGFICTDIDECANGTAKCGANTVCTNTPGSYACTCQANFADCDSDMSNGCEANLQTDANNCAACGGKCSNNNIGAPTCAAGVCTGACNANFSDCNDNKKSDGCEVNLLSDVNNCSACGKVCNSACTNGSCGSFHALFANGSGYACPTGATKFQYSGALDPASSVQAKAACEACYGVGTCADTGGDCAGNGWGPPGPQSGKAYFGYQNGCSGSNGRAWFYGSSYTTFGYWGLY